MKISNLEFDIPVFLAPMAGVTDEAYREICSDMGCGLTYTEMVSAKGLYYGSENTESLMKVSPLCGRSAIQIFGSDADIMSEICKRYINDNDNFCLVDINMGCPVPKIVKNGEGSALMKNPLLAGQIVESIKKISTKPVTVKMRIGFDEEHRNAVEFAKVLEKSGADAIAVHGRTRQQMYEGKADYNMIAEVKSSVSIPVIGNGDVFSAKDAERLKNITGCDGILVARGAMGNPWIFKQINSMLKGEDTIYPSSKEKLSMCIRHYELVLKYESEYKAVREMRKHIGWYIKGIPHCSDIKNMINSENDWHKVIEILKSYEHELEI